MASKPRTFKLGPNPKRPMRGKDIKEWQADVKSLFKSIGINCPIKVDGTYGQATRSFSASLCEAYGLVSKTAMKDGVTPELRAKLRHKKLTKAEKTRMDSKSRKSYRDKLRDQWRVRKVHAPVSRIITDSWGYHPGVHDGVDVISTEGAAAFAMVKCRVIDVRTSGWWGNNPSGDVSRGDGIVQMEVLETVGPFKKGMHIGYGHCEHPRVRKGQVVQAGEVVALVGFAVAAHIHLMANTGKTSRGVGNVDPRPLIDYAVKHG